MLYHEDLTYFKSTPEVHVFISPGEVEEGADTVVLHQSPWILEHRLRSRPSAFLVLGSTLK